MAELKPCPFCGSKDLENCYMGEKEGIACRNCGAEGPMCLDFSQAIDAWNKRREK